MKQKRNRNAASRGMTAAAAIGAAAMTAAALSTVRAGDPAVVTETEVIIEEAESDFESFADRLWSIPVLYENENNPYIQKAALIGRYQGQWHYTDATTGDDSGWENRRWRIGAEVEFLQEFTFDAQFNLNRDTDWEGRFVEDVEEASIEWTPTDDVYFVVGKHKPKVTQEWSTSSRKILTFERSLLVNQTAPGKVGGFVAGATIDRWLVEGGVWTGDLDEDWAYPQFGGGVGVSARVGYELTENTGVRLDYFYNDGDEGNVGFSNYQHLWSLNSESQWDRVGLITDLIAASGVDDVNDVFGVVVMPYYDITDKLRFVARYQYATSDSDDGIRLQSRYERPAVEDGSSTRGDDYHAIYGGLNYYLYGDKLKVMAGVEWSTLGGDADYDGWTFLTGVRMYF